ncbi:GNAT family N-acetyltransferase [Jiella sp. M17.18]|uniref:GNAT family N-acetyltransferase n=1 Tax=Jiella sp. M17.18 TaxID=3234247 RepID=UPI0034DF9763
MMAIGKAPAGLRLLPVGPDNRSQALALQLGPGQSGLVASNRDSLREARRDPDAQPRLVLNGDQAVGFLMYDASPGEDEARLYRFMIDRTQQRKGLGRAALRLVLDEIARLDHVIRISICYEPSNEAARRLYTSAGFIETGLDEDGEMIALLELRP